MNNGKLQGLNLMQPCYLKKYLLYRSTKNKMATQIPINSELYKQSNAALYGISPDVDTDFVARRYISTIYVDNLPRLCTTTLRRSNKRKWLNIKETKSKWYRAENVKNTDYVENPTLLANASAVLRRLKLPARSISRHVDVDRTEFVLNKMEPSLFQLARLWN